MTLRHVQPRVSRCHYSDLVDEKHLQSTVFINQHRDHLFPLPADHISPEDYRRERILNHAIVVREVEEVAITVWLASERTRLVKARVDDRR